MKISSRLLSVLALVIFVSHSVAALSPRAVHGQEQTQETAAPLTNQDVIAMVKTGLSTEIIVAKIKASVSKFDTSTSALQELKTAGIADEIILAMVQAPSGEAANKTKEVIATSESSNAGTGETKALVYVYRKKNFGTRNMQPSVYADGVEVARMDDGKYFIITLDPGKHKIEVNKGHSGAEIDMKAGEKYYFRVEIVSGFWKGRGSIDFIQKEQGELEMQKMKPLEAKWIKDKSKVTVEDPNAKAQ